ERLRASRGRRCRTQKHLTRPLAGVKGEACSKVLDGADIVRDGRLSDFPGVEKQCWQKSFDLGPIIAVYFARYLRMGCNLKLLLVGLALFPVLCASQERPSDAPSAKQNAADRFIGEWKLNTKKSSSQVGIESETIKIETTGSEYRIEYDQT